MPLHRKAPDPLYVQVKESLLDEIHAGRYLPNACLPSERELASHFGVSRMTVRQALLDLAHDGAIYTRAGKGTFVAAPKIDQQLRTLSSFSQDVYSRGGQPASRLLDQREEIATPELAVALRLPPGAPILVLTRLRLSDGMPLAIETAMLPKVLCPNLFKHDFAVESLYQVLRADYGIELTQAEQTIEATLASPQEAELLDLTLPAAVLRIQRLTLSSDGRAVEFVHSTYRSDRYKFHTLLTLTKPQVAMPWLVIDAHEVR